MAKLLLDRIKFSSEDFKFDFEFRYGVTLISGNSATGKSLFFERLFAYVDAIGKDGFIFMNYLSKGSKEVITTALSLNNKVIVVDNADLLLKKIDNLDAIFASTNSQYILMGRNVALYPVNRYSMADIVEDDKYFRLQYMFD